MKEEEEEEEEEYSWTLGEGEKELVPKQWSETIIHFALRRYPTIQPLSRRLKKLIVDVIRPNACQANVRYDFWILFLFLWSSLIFFLFFLFFLSLSFSSPTD